MKRLDALTLKQLRSLQLICDTGSLSAAAEAMRLTPPAVHSQIRILEDNFGCRLLDRTGPQGFRATAEGAALLRAHDRIRTALDRALTEIDALAAGQTGSVVLGAVSTAKYVMPGLVARFQRARPGIEIVLRIGNRARILAGLEAGEFDLAFMGRPPRVPEVVALTVGDHPHVLIAPPDHPLAGAGAVPAARLLAETFILREPGSGTRILTTRFLDETGRGTVTRQVEMDSNETIKQAVRAGLGIAILSGHTVHEELATGRLIALQAAGLPILRQWFMVHRADMPPSSAARALLDWVEANRGDLLPVIDTTA